MSTTGSLSNRERLIVVAGIVLILAIVTIASTSLVPGKALAQPAETNHASSLLARTSTPPPPPPAMQLNPPAGTPEPGTVDAGAEATAGGGDIEVLRFRPQVSLRRGESPPIVASEKPTDAGRSSRSKQSLGEALGLQEDYQAPDVAGLLRPLDWNPLVYEDFEGIFPGAWILEDFGDDGGLYLDRTWGDTNYDSQFGYWSAWPAAGGADALDPAYDWYSDNLNSWMEYGPLDLSNMADVFVSFGLRYDTEPEFDNVYFCASIDFVNYSCVSWSGYSGGWTDQAFWLTSYAGYSQVWLAWVFISDESISQYYEGPFVDEVWAWGYDVSATPSPTPTPDPAGELVQNGSFETGDLTPWESVSWGSAGASEDALEDKVRRRPALDPSSSSQQKLSSGRMSSAEDELGVASVGVTGATAVDGQYSAFLWDPDWGSDFLYQTIYLPAGVTDVVLNFWFGVTTYETQAGNDWFCVSMSDPNDHADIWVDLGCMDARYTTGHWQEVLYVLDEYDMQAIAGKPEVDLVFELYNRRGYGTGTAGWVDYVRAYAVGGGGGSPVDPNEPNDSVSDATEITCGETIAGTVGDAMGDYGDMDVFRLENVPPGQLDIDIRADTQVPPSALDSVVGLWDSDINLVAWNDDDGISYDSYVTYTVESASTYFISVESYSGYGGPDSFYDLTVQCAGSGGGPPPGGDEQPPENPGAWTLMLYLNAEDKGFELTLRKYIRDMQAVLSEKSAFLTVAVLYDGPNDGDTVRYLLQPDGVYEDGVNRWPVGERNMGHPDTLSAFANWAMDQYPAEHYYLAIDDHGHGVYGISWDQTNGDDALTPPELYSALKDVTHNGSRKIDIFDYEACLMGMAEIAYDVREWVDYVSFFEQISWGINTYPVYFLDLKAMDLPVDVGQRIVDRYYEGAKAAGYPHAISFIETSRMSSVKQAITDLGDALVATGDNTLVNNRRSSAQAFAADDDATNADLADYIDLWDLADKTSSLSGAVSGAAADVKSAVQNAVVAERHWSGQIEGLFWDHSGVHGLSVYYPASNASSAFRDYTAPRLFQMSTDESGILGHWDEFLLWAVTTGGNGAGDGLGGGDRRGMSAGRFLQPRLGGSKFVYLPLVIRQ